MGNRPAQRWVRLLALSFLLGSVSCSGSKEIAQTEPVIRQWGVFEKALVSNNSYSNRDKYRAVALTATFTGPGGERHTVPGFWDGENIWRIRFAPPEPGRWSYGVDSTDDQLDAPHNDGSFTAVKPTAEEKNANANFRGFLKASANRRYLTYGDGTPFFWLGDTLWDGNSKNMAYETDFKNFIDNRRQKSFSVMQILVAEPRFAVSQSELQGCRPPRYTGCNEAGFVFELPSALSRLQSRVSRLFSPEDEPYADQINPASFQNLDLRIKYIVDRGMVPYVVFGWDKDYERLPLDWLKPYVRYIVARYQAYNVIWCVAGEEYRLKDKTKFKEIGAYLRELDGARHLKTIHGWGGELGKEPWVDFISATAWAPPARMREVMLEEFRPTGLPYAMTESRYDGIEPGPEYRARSYAWEAMAAGALGYTYGADGIWDWGTYFPQFPDPRARIDIPSAFEMKIFAEFFAGIEWWKLTATDGLTNKGRVLAEPDKQYLVWLGDGGSFTLELPARQAQFSATWLDPIRGKKIPSSGITPGGKQSFTPPFAGDAVFYLTLETDRPGSEKRPRP